MKALGYRPQLDGLRALAVGGVLYSHLYDLDSNLGGYGVRLFFVISGYLITGILLRCRATPHEGGSNDTRLMFMWRFYVRRALRIYPAYYVLLFFAAAVNMQNIRHTLLFHALFLSNILFAVKGTYTPWVTAHFWSLSVEEQFYLAWPLAIIFTPKRFLMPVVFGTGFLGVGFKLFAALLGAPDFFRWFLTPASLDALAGGALLALVPSRQAWPRWLIPVALSAGVVCALPLLKWTPHPVLQEVFQAISILPFIALVAMASSGIQGVFGRILGSAPMVYLGRISFGIYLYHPFIEVILFHIAPRWGAPSHRGMPLLLIGSLLTIAVASVSWWGLEQPFNALKRNFPMPVRQ